jgi:hypothetical protein
MNDETTPRRFAGDWYIIATDETSGWVFDNFKDVNGDDIRKYVEKILRISAFDRRRHSYLCELTPSYELIDLGVVVHYTDLFYSWQLDATSVNIGDADAWRDTFEAELFTSDYTDGVEYVHTRGIDNFINTEKQKRRKYERLFEHIGNISGRYWREEDYETELDAVREYNNGGNKWM